MRFFEYPYLIFAIVNGILWGLFYFLRPDLRKKMWLSSIVGGILGLTELIFVPRYWSPRFPVIPLVRSDLYLESLLFSFFFGGVGALFYQVLFGKPLLGAGRVPGKVLFALPAVFFLYPLFPQLNVMHFCIASSLACGSLIVSRDRKLAVPMLLNGLLLLGYAFGIYHIFWDRYPLVAQSFNENTLSGIRLRGIPVEELLFFFSIGVVWCLFYELLGNGRLRKRLGVFYPKEAPCQAAR
jgi:hypothetical protein